MSPQGVYPLEDVCGIGDQISSTGEGRHITLYADNLSHGTNVSYVTKGYPVWFVDAVGMPFRTQAAGDNELEAVDTEGIWCVDVHATADAGDIAVTSGDKLYVNTTTGVVSKINNVITQLPFGYALGQVTSGEVNRIAVKVHFDPSMWTNRDMYAVMTAGRDADDAYSIRVTDATTETDGYSKALLITYDNTGVKTGTATVECMGMEMTITAACITVVTGLEIYLAAVANVTVGRITAIEVYHETRGNAVASDYVILLGRNSNAVLTGPGNDAFIYFREHSTVQQESSVFMLQGNNAAEYLIAFGSNPGTGLNLIEDSAATESVTHRVRCNTTVGVRWLHLHDQ